MTKSENFVTLWYTLETFFVDIMSELPVGGTNIPIYTTYIGIYTVTGSTGGAGSADIVTGSTGEAGSADTVTGSTGGAGSGLTVTGSTGAAGSGLTVTGS